MKTVHRIAANLRDPVPLAELARLGIPYDISADIVVATTDDEVAWERVQPWIQHHGASVTQQTVFTAEEVERAPWLGLRGTWINGYPQPVSRYQSASYDTSAACETCSIGKVQRAPIRLTRPPRWAGARRVFQVYWLNDELFVHPATWDAVFAPRGVERREVVNRQGRTLDTVVQLVIPVAARLRDGELARLGAETCPACGQARIPSNYLGPFPALAEPPSLPLVKTAEYVGTGELAHHGIVASRELAVALRGHDRDILWRPVAD